MSRVSKDRSVLTASFMHGRMGIPKPSSIICVTIRFFVFLTRMAGALTGRVSIRFTLKQPPEVRTFGGGCLEVHSGTLLATPTRSCPTQDGSSITSIRAGGEETEKTVRRLFVDTVKPTGTPLTPSAARNASTSLTMHAPVHSAGRSISPIAQTPVTAQLATASTVGSARTATNVWEGDAGGASVFPLLAL